MENFGLYFVKVNSGRFLPVAKFGRYTANVRLMMTRKIGEFWMGRNLVDLRHIFAH